MAYVKVVDFAAKDVLLTGNPAKLIKGTEIGAEFDAIATATTTMDANLTAHTGAASAAHAGTAISNTPAGGIAATTVQAAINELDTEKAPIASPTFTGVPAAPTAAGGTNTTQLATTAFVNGEVATEATARANADALLAPLANPTFTGVPAAPTATGGTATTQLATTAFATNQDIGVGQTWQVVTRAIGGSYTNSTGKPIQIAVSVTHNAAASSALLTVGGVAVANTFDDGGRRQIISAVIPNGASYGVTQASGTIVLNNWTELR